jgi:hypothetical protein
MQIFLESLFINHVFSLQYTCEKNITKYFLSASLGVRFHLKESLVRRKPNFEDKKHVSAVLKNPSNPGAECSRGKVEHTCSYSNTPIINFGFPIKQRKSKLIPIDFFSSA